MGGSKLRSKIKTVNFLNFKLLLAPAFSVFKLRKVPETALCSIELKICGYLIFNRSRVTQNHEITAPEMLDHNASVSGGISTQTISPNTAVDQAHPRMTLVHPQQENVC